MEKSRTIGKLGELYFKKLLQDNGIEFEDLTSKLKGIKKIEVKSVNINGEKKYYDYLKNSRQHPYDFQVGRYGVEVKTATWRNNGKVVFNFQKNNLKKIDYVIGILLKDEKVYNWYFWRGREIKEKSGIGFNPLTTKTYFPETEEKIIIKLTNQLTKHRSLGRERRKTMWNILKKAKPLKELPEKQMNILRVFAPEVMKFIEDNPAADEKDFEASLIRNQIDRLQRRLKELTH